MLDIKYLKVGDTVRLKGDKWLNSPAYFPKVGSEQVITVIKGGNKAFFDHGDRVGDNGFYVGNPWGVDWDYDLVERDGKRVRLIIEGFGCMFVMYQDGTTEQWSAYRGTWTIVSEKFKPAEEYRRMGYAVLYESKSSEVVSETLDDAIERIKNGHPELCEEFDVQVARARKIAGSDGDLRAVLELIAKEHEHEHLIKELDAPRKLKWPKGATLQVVRNRDTLRTLAEDCYEGDTHVRIKGTPEKKLIGEYRRVEIKEID